MSNLSQTDTVTEMDAKISSYSKLLETVSDKEKPNLQTKLLSAKLMREKFVAMTAFAKAQSLLAEMEVLVAKNNLKSACEELDVFKKELDEKTEKKSHKSKENQKTSTQKRSRESTPKNNENSNKKVSRRESKSKSDSQITRREDNSKTKSQHKRKRRHSDSNHSTSKRSKTSQEKSESLTQNSLSPIKNNNNDEPRPKIDSNLTNSKSSGLSRSKKSKTSDKSNSLTLKSINNSDGSKTNANVLKKTIEQSNYCDDDTVIIENLTDHSSNGNQLSKSNNKEMPSKMQILFEDDQFSCVKMERPSDLNTTEDLVNGLFKDILTAKMKISHNESDLNKTKLRELLEQC